MNKQIKEIRTPRIKKPTVRYAAFCNELISKHYKIHNSKCAACRQNFWRVRNEKYCIECTTIKNKITKRIDAEKRFDRYRKQTDIITSIKYSDDTFNTDLCNMDCFNCIYADCILEGE